MGSCPVKLGVAILGGGMAGGLLARQLSRALPDLTIGLFERSEEAPYKLGESMPAMSIIKEKTSLPVKHRWSFVGNFVQELGTSFCLQILWGSILCLASL